MKNTPLNILIPNATGMTNIGDQAMLVKLIDIIRNEYPKSKFTIHSSLPELYDRKFAHKIDHTLYSWAVFSNTSALSRISKLAELLIKYLCIKTGIGNEWGNPQLNKLIRDYKTADIIFFVGGGYFRSKPGFTQTLNALMQLSMVEFSKLYNQPKVFAPISFGPFAYAWLERISAMSLKNIHLVSVRENFSYKKLYPYHLNQLVESTDHALLLNKASKNTKKNKNFTVGFTIRKWLEKDKQANFESSFTDALIKFSKQHHIVVQPIIQVDAPEYGDFDYQLTQEVVSKLQVNQIKVNPIFRPKNLDQAIQMYSTLDLLLGMRMHSNILAATQHVPFIAIAYEYKTIGISQYLHIDKYSVWCDQVTSNKLLKLLQDIYTNYDDVRAKLITRLSKVQAEENLKWNSIMKTIY